MSTSRRGTGSSLSDESLVGRQAAARRYAAEQPELRLERGGRAEDGDLEDRGHEGPRVYRGGGAAPSDRLWSNTFVAMAIMPAMSLTLAGTTIVLPARAMLPNCCT